MLQRKMNEAHVTRKKAHDRVIESQKGESSEASKVIRKEAQANKNKLEDVFEADIQGLKDRLKAIKDVLTGSGLSSQDLQKGNVKFKKGYKIIDGERVPNMTGEQATVLVELVRDFQAFKDKAVKEYGVSSLCFLALLCADSSSSGVAFLIGISLPSAFNTLSLPVIL